MSGPKIEVAHINALMERVVVVADRVGETTSTAAHAFLDGTFFLATGHSACVSPENFNHIIGAEMAIKQARERAREKLWELEGYLLYKELNDAK